MFPESIKANLKNEPHLCKRLLVTSKQDKWHFRFLIKSAVFKKSISKTSRLFSFSQEIRSFGLIFASNSIIKKLDNLEITRLFRQCGLPIGMECNLKTVYALDVIFNFINNFHKARHKANEKRVYKITPIFHQAS